jgi:adenine-specific DNA methylase
MQRKLRNLCDWGTTEKGMRKKLIEVALPLDAINEEASRGKSIRHGIHRRSICGGRAAMVACGAVLFAQMVDDPSSHPDEFPTEDGAGAQTAVQNKTLVSGRTRFICTIG